MTTIRVSQLIVIKHTINYYSVQVKPRAVMDEILGTVWCNVVLVHMFTEQSTFKWCYNR
jgi:hypothetical protein